LTFAVVAAQRVSKVYHLYYRPADRILAALPFTKTPRSRDFYALRDVSLHVKRGEFLGIVGPNGSGKSTFLQILSGILQPTQGRIITHGRVAALLELGAGFNPESNGRENVRINAEILGLTRGQISRALPLIEEFAGVGEFIDRPVKEYSSGMYVRLAFATAIHVEPEILLVDETLAVGDAAFANRCIHKFEELKDKGVTVLFVSHDLGLVKRLSDRAILMLQGRIAAEGKPSDVVNRYVGHVLERERGSRNAEDTYLSSSFRHGDGSSRVFRVMMLNSRGEESTRFASGERMEVRVIARFLRRTENPVVGLLVRNRLGIDVYGTNTRLHNQALAVVEAGEEIEATFRFDCLFTEQEYTLTVATQHWDGMSQDWLDDVKVFEVVGSNEGAGLVNLPTEVEWCKKQGLGS
jgi:ABC-type polysaccharide/polyol phosphate transport system ATPase subunit